MIRALDELPNKEIARLCEKYSVEELSVFGSFLRDDFCETSDVDFLVKFVNDDCGVWMHKPLELEQELSLLLGRNVEVVSRIGIEQSRNWIRRKNILESARVIYESR